MSFLKEGKLHIAVESDCDFFEAGKGSIDADRLREKFYEQQIRWFTDRSMNCVLQIHFIDKMSV